MNDIATVPAFRPTSTANSVGQATAVEQSRAVAEVQAAVLAAKHMPRDTLAAVEAMREACSQPALASKAFFRYPRAGSQITGASIHLARELARVWGNMQYGLHELRRDDDGGESEMQSFAWDLQTNTRNASTFVVPHARDTKSGGRVPLTDLRDIYENNANQGARRVREAIFATLPTWFVEEAKGLCMQTIESGGGKPLAQRVVDAIAWFEGAGVRLVQLEDKLGAKRDAWRAIDVAQLEVIARSLRVGETTVGDEFPAARVSDDDFDDDPPKARRKRKVKKAEAAPAAPEAATPEVEAQTSQLDDDFAGETPPPDVPEPADEPGDSDVPVEDPPTVETGEPISDGQRGKMFALFNELGMADARTTAGRQLRLDYITNITGVQITSSNELTSLQASAVIDALIVDLEQQGSQS